MTNEEAIKILEYRRCFICQTCHYFHTPIVCESCREINCKGEKEAIKKAIQALKSEPKHGVSLIESEYLLNEIDELDWYRISNGNFIEGAKEESEAFYRAEDVYRVIKNARRYNYCPNCGADMREVE